MRGPTTRANAEDWKEFVLNDLNDKPRGNDVSGGDAIDFSTLQLLEETADEGR